MLKCPKPLLQLDCELPKGGYPYGTLLNSVLAGKFRDLVDIQSQQWCAHQLMLLVRIAPPFFLFCCINHIIIGYFLFGF